MDCKKWLLYPIAGYLPAIVFCESAGIDRGTTISLSSWTIEACALVLAPLGFLPALCLYFKQAKVSGSAAWRIQNASPVLGLLLAMPVAGFFGLATFGAGLYFANIGAQHGSQSAQCAIGRFLEIHHATGRRRSCQAWARILLSSGQIVRPCLTAPEWLSASDDPQVREGEVLFIAVNKNVFGRSISAVASHDNVGLLGPVDCPAAGILDSDARTRGLR